MTVTGERQPRESSRRALWISQALHAVVVLVLAVAIAMAFSVIVADGFGLPLKLAAGLVAAFAGPLLTRMVTSLRGLRSLSGKAEL